MPGKDTVIVFVHGANQSEKTRQANEKAWIEAFKAERQNSEWILPFLEGDARLNGEIAKYHERKHGGSDYPRYRSWFSAWYGGVWQSLRQRSDPPEFGDHLNSSGDEDRDDRTIILQKVEQGVMAKHFDELVPFYELAVCPDGETLYEKICSQFLDELARATNQGELGYVLVAHSMGCAVTYNVMTHLGREREGQPYCETRGALSDTYRQKVRDFVLKEATCFGLLTFGNYTGYNWCQRMNQRLLFGQPARQFSYPREVARWRNFWTVLGGDPYIIDDMLGNSMVDDEDDRFDDLTVWRVPFRNVGHGRVKWFKRDIFVRKLRNQLSRHLYK